MGSKASCLLVTRQRRGGIVARKAPAANSQKTTRTHRESVKSLCSSLGWDPTYTHTRTHRRLLLLPFLQGSPASRRASLGVKSTFFPLQFPTHSAPSKKKSDKKRERSSHPHETAAGGGGERDWNNSFGRKRSSVVAKEREVQSPVDVTDPGVHSL